MVGLQIVTDMLGLMDKNQVLKLVHAVVQKDSAKVMQQVELMSNQAPDYALVLAEIMSLLHQIALTQFVPDACKLETISARAIFQLAKTVPAEQIQLLYQIALTGKKDLPHAADPRTGLEMTLLRMLAFCPNNLKLDALDIAANTPDVEMVFQQPASGSTSESQTPAKDKFSTDPIATAPVADVSNDMSHQGEPAPEPVIERSEQKTSTIEEMDENSPPLQEEISTEVSIKPQPELIQERSHQPQTDQVAPPEVDLFAQQQDIMSQAESFGHQPIDYDQYQPVALDEQPSDEFAVDYEPMGSEPTTPENMGMQGQNPQVLEEQKLNTSTADLIALRNKLKQRQRDEGEGAEQVKKSEKIKFFER